MAAEPHPAALDRIERAIARIEAAGIALSAGRATLVRRHDALRARVAEAIEALDAVLDPAGHE